MTMPAPMSDARTTSPDLGHLFFRPAARDLHEDGHWRDIGRFVGKVNSREFEGHPAGTVLLAGVDCDVPPPVEGETAAARSLVLNFRARDEPWNLAYRMGVPGLVFDARGNPIYESADFAPLVD